MLVDLIIEDARWEALGLADLAERACAAVAADLGLSGAEVAVLACDDARIAELNGDFRDKPTTGRMRFAADQDDLSMGAMHDSVS